MNPDPDCQQIIFMQTDHLNKLVRKYVIFAIFKKNNGEAGLISGKGSKGPVDN